MAMTGKGWMIAVLVALVAVVAFAVGMSRFRQPLRPPTAPSAAACGSTAECAAGFRCVAPGLCSKACSTDADCPPGRRCAEIRAMEPGEENPSAPTVVTTCVAVTPG